MKFIRAFSLALVLTLTLASLAYAWPDDSFARIDISGPNIIGEVQITDPALLDGLTIESFTDFTEIIPQPEGLGDGYRLHRYFKAEDGSLWDFDIVQYYADPQGGPGYIYYESALGYGPSHHTDKWYRATPQTETDMQELFASLGLTPGGAASTTSVTTAAVNPSWLFLWLSLLVLAAGFGAMLVIRRRRPA